MEDVQVVSHWAEAEYRTYYLSYEQLIILSTDKRLDTGKTREKKMTPNTVNFLAKVTGIRHTDHGDVLMTLFYRRLFKSQGAVSQCHFYFILFLLWSLGNPPFIVTICDMKSNLEATI